MESIVATINYTFPDTVDSYNAAVEHLRQEGPLVNLNSDENNINVHVSANVDYAGDKSAWTAVINISSKGTNTPATPQNIVPVAPFNTDIENRLYDDFHKLGIDNTFEAFDVGVQGEGS